MFNKILYLISLSFLLVLSQQCLASMSSTDYEIWVDTMNSGGGSQVSGSFSIDASGSSLTNPQSASDNFRERADFAAIDDEPTVGFNVNSTTMDFGELSHNSTAYTSNTFSAYTNSSAGYTVKVYGQPLHSSEYALDAIGATPADSAVGTEQFGINLVANTVPIIGADPVGGSGQAATAYSQTNKYAYEDGATIAYADSFTFQTDYTVSVIINIAEETPAGVYDTMLTYELVPLF